MIQKELAALQVAGLPAYFKGGAALYEDLKTTNRFLRTLIFWLDTRGNSRKQNNKRLEYAAPKYVSLPRDASQGRTNQSETIAVHIYVPITILPDQKVWRPYFRHIERHIEKVMKADITCGILIKEAYKKL